MIGVEDIHYLPYFDFSVKQSHSFTQALFDQFASDSGFKIKYLPLPIKQMPKWLANEKIDFKFPDNEMWPKVYNVEKLPITYSDQVVPMVAGTLVLNENQNIEQSSIRSVGTISGFQTTFWREEINRGEVSLLQDPSPRILVQYLVNGLVDGLVIDIVVANRELKDLNLKLDKPLVYAEKLSQARYAYKLSTIKHPDVLHKFNRWLKENQPFVEELKREFGILNQNNSNNDMATQK